VIAQAVFWNKSMSGNLRCSIFTSCRNRSEEEVARILRVSAAQVYLAKHRMARLLKKEVAKLERGQESGIRV
jgi:hypothetical protein